MKKFLVRTLGSGIDTERTIVANPYDTEDKALRVITEASLRNPLDTFELIEIASVKTFKREIGPLNEIKPE